MGYDTYPYGSLYKDAGVMGKIEAAGQAAMPQPFTIHFVKNSLNGGELSPELAARFDLPRYQSGCKSLLNMLPLLTGGVTKRPPFQIIKRMDSGAARLCPYVYSASKQAMLVFSSQGGKCKVEFISNNGSGLKDALTDGNLPYNEDAIHELSICQCGKNLYIAHHDYPPMKLDCVKWAGYGPQFKSEEIDFSIKTPSPGAPLALRSYGIWDDENREWHNYVMTAIDKDTGEESLPGPCLEVLAPPRTQFRIDFTISEPVENCVEYRIYKKKGGVYGFIGRYLTEQMEFFTDDGITPDTADTPPVNPDNPFTEEGDYPSIVFIHQQRLGWAASDNQPLTIWMSQTSNFECRATKQPPNDDDAIEVTIASARANRIMWALSDRTGLAIGTEGAEWFLTGADGNPAISPNSLSFQAQTEYGSEEGVEPLRCGPSLVFCQRGGKHPRNLGYSFQSDRYEASDLALMASHLFRFARIKSWAWQGGSECIIWMVTNLGQLLGCTHLPEHEIISWHRHSTPGGKFESVACLDDKDGDPRLWAIIQRGGSRYLEIMDTRYMGEPGEWDAGAARARTDYREGPDRQAYPARCVPFLPEIQVDTGSTFMRVKKINAIKARVINSRPFRAQVHSQELPSGNQLPVPIRPEGFAEYAEWACPIGAGFREGASLELVFDEPEPVTVLGLTIAIDIAATGGGQ